MDCSLLDAAELREAEPELRGERLLGGSWFPRDLQCAPRAIARALAREAAALGAVVRTGVEVDAIPLEGGRVEGVLVEGGERLGADHVVLAAGAWSAPRRRCRTRPPAGAAQGPAGAARTPSRLPAAQGDRRQLLAAVASPDLGLQVSTVVETTLHGHVLVGSSRERRGFDVEVDPHVSAALLEAAARIAPGVRELSVRSAWAGLRPWLPSGLRRSGRALPPRAYGWPPATRAPAWRTAP